MTVDKDAVMFERLANSKEWKALDGWIQTEIMNTTERLVTKRNITPEEVARHQERVATLKYLRATINKYKHKEE